MPRDRIIVLGSSNTDLVIRGPRLPRPGETVLGGEFYRAAGGKGANQAVAAARASRGPVTFIAAVGDDAFGTAATEGFTDDGIDTRFVKIVPGRASGVALILVDEAGENLISVASGANLALAPSDVDAVPDEVFDQAGVFLASLESTWPTVRRGLERAKQFGLTTILNPAPATEDILEPGGLELVDVLTPNEGEAAMLADAEAASGETADLAARAREAADRLRQLGCGACVVTLGQHGCLVVDDGCQQIQAVHVDAVDATAAGDAFNGAMAAALAEGQSVVDAARWANVAASISVTRPGAQPSLARREEIERVKSNNPSDG